MNMIAEMPPPVKVVWNRWRSMLFLHPVIALNLGLFLVFVCCGYFLYAGYIIPQGDALSLLSVHKAESIWDHIYAHYTQGEGRFTIVLLWAALQRFSFYFFAESTDFPTWLLISGTQFALVGSAINVTFLLKRIFSEASQYGLVIFLFFIGFYSTNPHFFVYTLQPGAGMYAIYTYTFTAMCMLFTGHYSQVRYVCGYVLYVILLLGSDTMWGPSVCMVLFVTCLFLSQKGIFIRQFVLALAIPLITSLIVFFSPGYQARASGLPQAGYELQKAATFNDFFDGLGLYVGHLVHNAYPALKSNYLFADIPINWLWVHGGVTLFAVVTLLMYVLKRKAKLKENKFSKSVWGVIGFYGVALFGLHATLLRWFVSQYHGVYANDGPTFILLILLVTISLGYIGRFSKKKEKSVWWRLVVVVLLVFVSLPNLAICAHQIAWSKVHSLTCVTTYNHILADIESKNTNPITYVVNGTPMSPVFLPSLTNSLARMLEWHGVSHIRFMTSGFPGYQASDTTDTLNVYVPKVLPGWRPFYLSQKPELVRAQVFMGEYIRDYQVPEQVAGLRFLVTLNPNVLGSSSYVSRYYYRLLFSAGWDYGRNAPAQSFDLTLMSKSEGRNLQRFENPVAASWLVEDKEHEFLPLGMPQHMRLRVRGGNSEYTFINSKVYFLPF